MSSPSLFRRIRSLWIYEGKVRTAISAMKYKPSPRLCRQLGDSLGAFARYDALWQKGWNRIVPIPSSPESISRRGFNQAQILAQRVAVAMREIRKIPVTPLLAYEGRHERQALLPHGARSINTRGMFRCLTGCEGLSLLLVDDVLTTGATASAAAESLLRAGASSVDLLTLARSPVWERERNAPLRRSA